VSLLLPLLLAGPDDTGPQLAGQSNDDYAGHGKWQHEMDQAASSYDIVEGTEQIQ
jgi:hypothetical protein